MDYIVVLETELEEPYLIAHNTHTHTLYYLPGLCNSNINWTNLVANMQYRTHYKQQYLALWEYMYLTLG